MNNDQNSEQHTDKQNVIDSLRSGEPVTQFEFERASAELWAFFLFNGLKYDDFQLQVGTMPIPISVVLRSCSATDGDAVELRAEQLVGNAFAEDSLPPVDAKRQLAPAEQFEFQQSPEAREQIRLAWYKRKTLQMLAPIAGRKEGWSLLNMRSEATLKDKVEEALGSDHSAWMIRTKTLSSYAVIMLLVRRNKSRFQPGRTANANRQTTSAQRAQAGKKGAAARIKKQRSD